MLQLILLFTYWIVQIFSGCSANEIVDGPIVKCTEEGITVTIKTENKFRGNLYVRGHFDEPQCRHRCYAGQYKATFTVPLGECGMRKIRQHYPPGSVYSVVIVISFHPQFLTKFDRAYMIKCFYAKNDKEVESKLEVSPLYTETVDETADALPGCEYSLRENSVDGRPIQYAKIGDRIVHRWECDNPSYGMLVKNCHVTDGSGTNVNIIDSYGCPLLSPLIQGAVTYDSNKNLAYVTAMAYKFPDKPQLYFECQIKVCNKHIGECDDVTPPQCYRGSEPGTTPSSVTDDEQDEGYSGSDNEDINNNRISNKNTSKNSKIQYFRRKLVGPIELPVVTQNPVKINKTNPEGVRSDIEIEKVKLNRTVSGRNNRVDDEDDIQIRKRRFAEYTSNNDSLDRKSTDSTDRTLNVAVRALFLGEGDFSSENNNLKEINEYNLHTTEASKICLTGTCLETFYYITFVAFCTTSLTTLLIVVVVYVRNHRNRYRPPVLKLERAATCPAVTSIQFESDNKSLIQYSDNLIIMKKAPK